MTHSPRLHLQEGAPLLPVTQQPQFPRAQPAPRSSGLGWWIFTTLAYGGGTGVTGYYSVTSIIAKSTTIGGALGAGALLCAGACAYCFYRVVVAIRHRDIKPIEPIENTAASKANVVMLRMIDSKLKTILNGTEAVVDLEAGVNDVELHESIHRSLSELAEMLPALREEIADLQGTIQAALESRSLGSPNGGLDSPSGDSNFERGLLGKLEALSKKTSKDQRSRNTSRLSSTTNSPISQLDFSLASPTGSPAARGNSNNGRRLTFGPINESTPTSPAGQVSTEKLDDE